MAGQGVRDLDPEDIAARLDADDIVLVDVREWNEIAGGVIPGAVAMPLSQFAPQDIPVPAGKEVVFYCAAGVRSVHASLAAQAAGFPYGAHLAGGIKAWFYAGLPIAPLADTDAP